MIQDSSEVCPWDKIHCKPVALVDNDSLTNIPWVAVLPVGDDYRHVALHLYSPYYNGTTRVVLTDSNAQALAHRLLDCAEIDSSQHFPGQKTYEELVNLLGIYAQYDESPVATLRRLLGVLDEAPSSPSPREVGPEALSQICLAYAALSKVGDYTSSLFMKKLREFA